MSRQRSLSSWSLGCCVGWREVIFILLRPLGGGRGRPRGCADRTGRAALGPATELAAAWPAQVSGRGRGLTRGGQWPGVPPSPQLKAAWRPPCRRAVLWPVERGGPARPPRTPVRPRAGETLGPESPRGGRRRDGCLARIRLRRGQWVGCLWVETLACLSGRPNRITQRCGPQGASDAPWLGHACSAGF